MMLLLNPKIVSEAVGDKTNNAHHGEQRGGQATKSQLDRVQASECGAKHEGKACEDCAKYQRANSIRNITGEQ
jgi:hypothetical protein